MTFGPQRPGSHWQLNDGRIIRLDLQCGQYLVGLHSAAPDHSRIAAVWATELEIAVAAAAAWILHFDGNNNLEETA